MPHIAETLTKLACNTNDYASILTGRATGGRPSVCCQIASLRDTARHPLSHLGRFFLENVVFLFREDGHR